MSHPNSPWFVRFDASYEHAELIKEWYGEGPERLPGQLHKVSEDRTFGLCRGVVIGRSSNTPKMRPSMLTSRLPARLVAVQGMQ